MEQLSNGYTLELSREGFPLSTDSMLLAHFAKLPRNARVLDLGSGCATLGHLLCAKDPTCSVTGLEIREQSHLSALENIRRNDLQRRISSICADLRVLPPQITPGSFHCCISNPPYFSGGPESAHAPAARQECYCTPDDLFQSAATALKFGGDFFLVHKPEKLGQLISCASRVNLEAKKLCLIRHRPDTSISLILLQFRKGAKPGLQLAEQCLFTSQGDPTPFYREVYHIP